MIKGCYRRPLQWFINIYINKCNFGPFIQIFLSKRALLRKYFLIVCFSLCYLNGKLRADSRIQNDQIGPPHHMECSLLFFWKLCPLGIWWKSQKGNNDLAKLMIEMFYLVKIVNIGNEIWNGNKNRASADFNRLI